MSVRIAWLLAGMVLVLLSISLLVVWKLMHPKRVRVTDNPARWELNFEDIGFSSRDGKVELKGWYLPTVGPAKMTIIFAHGYRGNRLQKRISALSLAKELVNNGYAVILFDFRNCGHSGGRITTIGLEEQHDILGAIDWCRARSQAPIGLIGHSMGAATSLLAAAACEEVSGVVADSPFGDLRRYLLNNLSVWSKLPKYPFSPMMVWMIRYIMGKNPGAVRPIECIRRIYPRPILFIHGDQDEAIPCSESEAMSACHADAFSFWKVPGARHVGSYPLYPNEYAHRVIRFFDRLAVHVLREKAQ